jgi:MFS family permease
MWRLLRVRDTRLYIFGSTVSTIGDTALWLTLSIWVKVLTGSTSAAGVSIFMLTLGTMTGPFSGLIVDRARRRPLLMVTYLLSFLLVIALLAVHGRHQVWLIDAVMFGYGVSNSLVSSAQTALVPSIVPTDALGEVNAILQTLGQGSRLVTPLLCAGLFAAFGATPVILADSASFLIAAAALLAIRVHEVKPTRSPEHWLANVTAGVRHINRTVMLRQVAIAGTFAVIAFGLSETVVYSLVTEGLHRPATFLGVLLSCQGVGAVISGLTAGRLLRRLGEGMLVTAGLAAAAVAFLLQIIDNLACVIFGFVLVGVCISWVIVGVVTMLQLQTPGELMGRADAALNFLLTAPQTIAIAAGAALVALVDYRLILLGMGVMLALAAGYLLSRPEQRKPVVAEQLAA